MTPIKPLGDFINGKFVRPKKFDEEIVSVDPGEQTTIVGTFPVSHQASQQALEAAHAAFPAWAAQPMSARIAALKRLRAELRNRSVDLATLLSLESGRPRWETNNELSAMFHELDAQLEFGLLELQPAFTPPGRSQVTFVPRGVMVVLTNYVQPALILHRDTIAALLCGCTVVAKPSELTPAIGQLYAEMVQEADFPRGVFNLVQGGPTCGKVLAQSPLADGILFTGSRTNGQHLAATLSQTSPKMLRNLITGQTSALVLDDADLDQAAYQLIIGACLSTGQRCTNTRKIFVHQRVAPALTERLIHLLAEIEIGHGSASNTFMGPLIDAPTVEEHFHHAALLRAVATELVVGKTKALDHHGSYVTPTLLQAPTGALPSIHHLELIGPLVTLITIHDIEEGLTLINACPQELTVSVFSRSERTVDYLQQHLTINLCLHNLPTTHWPSQLPLTFYSRQGEGALAGTLTFRACTRLMSRVSSDGVLDQTMLPPGLPLLSG